MPRFAVLSTVSAAAPVSRPASRVGVWPWLLALGLLAAYAAPWLVTDIAALSFGAYDLAEWATLPSAAKATQPPLLAALLLRLVLTAITLLVALWAGDRRGATGWWASLAVVALLAVTQLPPLEFFTIAQNDPNYGQQFMLAVASLVIGVGLLLAPRGTWRLWLAAAVAATGAAMSYAGASEALALARGFGLAARPGGGVWLAVGLFATAALVGLASTRKA